MEANEKIDRSMEHAWKYFELHAQQRMTVFNFFLAISGLIAAGIGVSLQQGAKFSAFATLLGIFLSLVSFLFWKLDKRVSVMIKRAESALCYIEQSGIIPEASIFSSDDKITRSKGFMSVWTYGKCFRVSFFTVGIIGLALAFAPYVIDFTCKA
ncbi:hypothetical protein OU5_P0004 (plasmid) [Pseudomonas mandelii JR-1]|uniref:SMODS and SLOG-associating 2TM effector domain-containing protein n=1 Tax=Pseudomonas mandelii JR-1 TaxID=1147786 RepID=A0A024EKY6_9PSED|nr:hypothetical protein [Pseudomonas mandelii]AHZ73256.1 hypothetical protein OU5_P0004 [Pseudomonas mandelii JR-1]OYQ15681.1 hypothetical protein B7L09_18685 [Pseudomonas mandelii]